MRTVLVIRHAHSTANDSGASASMTPRQLAFANESADLTQRGVDECRDLASDLPRLYGIRPSEVTVAVSKGFVRTRRTAELLGFRRIQAYAELCESGYDMPLDDLRAMLRKNRIPAIALATARATLRKPPSEDVWISHGLLIAGLCTVLGIAESFNRPVPRQCEVRRLRF